MKIFYIGQLAEGGTCLDRMRALQRLGHEVIGFDVSRYQSLNPLLRSVQWRWQPRLLLGELNLAVIASAVATGRLDCVWVDKGIWIFPEALRDIKRATGCRLVHFTPDSQILTNRSRHFSESIQIYDYLLTTKTFEIDRYRAFGARHIIFLTQSYCPIRFSNPAPEAGFTHDIGFVSVFKAPYGTAIRSLLSVTSDIGVWGPRWRRAAKTRRVPENVVRGDGIWGENYVNALASFRIGLGLLSKYIPEQHTTRSFEIPAAGTFLLAERTDEHQAYFLEGKEAEFFGAPEELISKARFYLRHDAARQRIAALGRERCHRSGYDIDSVLSRALKEIS